MKKFLAICIVGLFLGTAGAFADHPKGWGVGIVGGVGGIGWGSGTGGLFGVSLKAPMLPVYWGISFEGGNGYFGFGLTGDYYLIDKPLVPDIKLHWFLGVGGYLGGQFWNQEYWGWKFEWTHINFGARVPAGLSWQPFDFLEVFIDAHIDLGFNIWTDRKAKQNGNTYTDPTNKGGFGLGGGLGFELGARFWF